MQTKAALILGSTQALRLLLLSITLQGCAMVPETGRSQLLLVNEQEIAQLALSEFDKMKSQTPVSRDQGASSLVERVGRRIASVAPLPNARWEFVLFDEPKTLNAFCLPGGKVGVYTGILAITENEAGLATVLAHEVAHAVARHGAERISEGLLVQMGGQVLSAALQTQGPATQALVLGAYGIGGQVGVTLPHSRDQELEADHIGLIYMARAGYDPHEAVAFWKRFATYQKGRGGHPPEFLSTHPLDENRIAQIESLMAQAVGEYQKARRPQ